MRSCAVTHIVVVVVIIIIIIIQAMRAANFQQNFGIPHARFPSIALHAFTAIIIIIIIIIPREAQVLARSTAISPPATLHIIRVRCCDDVVIYRPIAFNARLVTGLSANCSLDQRLRAYSIIVRTSVKR